MKRFCLTFLTVLVLFFNSLAQSTFELGFLPSININKKLPNDWALNFKTESRQSLFKDDFIYDYLLTDVSLVASKKIGMNTSIALGYLIRNEGNEFENRTIQQIVFIKRHASFILSHRILADQTFKKNENTEYRLRYRISSEIPIQGRTLDPKEFFVKMSNEFLNSMHNKDYDLEIRGAAFLGYVTTPSSKIELGADYRVDSFIYGKSRNRLWVGLNIYLSI